MVTGYSVLCNQLIELVDAAYFKPSHLCLLWQPSSQYNKSLSQIFQKNSSYRRNLCVCVCVCVYMHTHTWEHTHTHKHTHIYVCKYIEWMIIKGDFRICQWDICISKHRTRSYFKYLNTYLIYWICILHNWLDLNVWHLVPL